MLNDLPLKERMKIERHLMPAQDAQVRITNFDEVNLGFTPELAREEAMRCLKCKDAPCSQGCPVHVHIPDFINQIVEGDHAQGGGRAVAGYLLPAICGRVCPQENSANRAAVLGKKGLPVASVAWSASRRIRLRAARRPSAGSAAHPRGRRSL